MAFEPARNRRLDIVFSPDLASTCWMVKDEETDGYETLQTHPIHNRFLFGLPAALFSGGCG
jgi:hypothetical protein